jgi:hypothetical protein
MRRHFNETVNKCPASSNNIELAEEIKEYILENRVYHIPKKNSDTIINYNTLNKFIVQMNIPDKINYLLEYQNKRLLDVEDDLEKHFQNRIGRLESDKYQGGYLLSEDGIFDLINKFTKVGQEQFERFNIFYYKAVKRFKLFRGTSWEEFLEDTGARELVALIKSYFLDNYEQYLIKHLHGRDVRCLNRVELKQHLEIYYRFIGIFDLVPYICDLEDQEVLGHRLLEENDNFLAKTYMEVYSDQKKMIKPQERKRTKRKIVDIINGNTIGGVSELNQILTDLLKVNQEFKQHIIDSLRPPS